jgi:hypothetical protein
MTKIGGYVRSIGAAIEFVPHLREAYETLKWSATFLGINLP